jgi:aryl-alcohol dehydrogenase-like predicted oxidoreductase
VLRRALDLGVNHIDTAAFYFSPLRSANELRLSQDEMHRLGAG